MVEEIQRLISIDSSVLIEYFRKTKKETTFLFKLSQMGFQGFVGSVAVHYEVYNGATSKQIPFWNNLFADILLIPYQPYINETAINITRQLKTKRKSIEFKDLLIAASALHYHYGLATLNEKHFEDIEGLKLITPGSFI